MYFEPRLSFSLGKTQRKPRASNKILSRQDPQVNGIIFDSYFYQILHLNIMIFIDFC